MHLLTAELSFERREQSCRTPNIRNDEVAEEICTLKEPLVLENSSVNKGPLPSRPVRERANGQQVSDPRRIDYLSEVRETGRQFARVDPEQLRSTAAWLEQHRDMERSESRISGDAFIAD